MTLRISAIALVILLVAPLSHAAERAGLANPAIDIDGYLRVAREAATHRGERRLSEDQFIRMNREPGTIILDARSGRFERIGRGRYTAK